MWAILSFMYVSILRSYKNINTKIIQFWSNFDLLLQKIPLFLEKWFSCSIYILDLLEK
jgi:hypothetical protein